MEPDGDAGTPAHPRDIGAGTRFQFAAKGFGQADAEISEYDEPTRLQSRASFKTVDATHRYVLRADGEGTRVGRS